MNAFSTLLHLLRTDLRRFRLSWLAFVAVHVLAVVIERAALPWGLGMQLLSLLRMTQMVGLFLLVAQVFLADSAAHSRSGWWTRPIGLGTLLASKTAYVLIALWLPLLAVYLVAWITDGFSARQLALAGGELSIYTLGAAALSAGIAAASPGFWKYAGTTGLALIGLFLTSWLVNVSPLAPTLQDLNSWTQSRGVFVMLLMLAFSAAGAACLAATVLRRRRVIYLGVAVIASIPLWIPGIETSELEDPPSHPGIAFAPLREGESRDNALLLNIALRGLPDHHYVIPINGGFTFSDHAGKTMRCKVGHRNHISHGDLSHAPLAARFLREVLPAGTRLRSSRSGRHAGLDLDLSGDASVDTGRPGRLAGEVQYLLYEADYAGTLSLERGARLRHQGHELAILDIDQHPTETQLSIRMVRPRLVFSRKLDDLSGHRWHIWSTWLLVMVQPDRGEAEVSQPPRMTTGGPFPVTDRSYTRISFARNDLARDREAPPELHAFRIVAKGVHAHRFEWNEHLAELDLRAIRDQHMLDGGGLDDKKAPLALDSLQSVDDLAGFYQDLSFRDRQTLQKKAAEVLAADIPGALARTPWRKPMHDALLETLTRQITEEHLPALREALLRDPRLIKVVAARKWGDRFSDYVRAQLARRSPATESDVIVMATALRDPALVDDLRWHFVHGRRGHADRLFRFLEAQPGFDAHAMLAEAWERGRLLDTQGDLWKLALEHGLPGAMDYCVRRIYQQGVFDRPEHSGLIQGLRQATAYEGDHRDFYEWITEHAADLQYDPATRRYRLPADE